MAPPPNWPISSSRPSWNKRGCKRRNSGKSSPRRWRKINWPSCEIFASFEEVESRGRRRRIFQPRQKQAAAFIRRPVRVWKITVTRKINNRPPPYPLEGQGRYILRKTGLEWWEETYNCKFSSLIFDFE